LKLMSDSTPPNCQFEIDDIEEPWTYRYKFDFINMRMMVGCVSDWPRCFKQCYEYSSPSSSIRNSNSHEVAISTPAVGLK